jgi:hypothetical protein
VERHEIMELLGQLKLAGMRAAYDEVVAAGVRAQHPFQRIFGELLLAQMADHRARSIAYRMGVARFPVMKNLAEFDFAASPVNQGLVRELQEGGFLATQRNAVLIGGTGPVTQCATSPSYWKDILSCRASSDTARPFSIARRTAGRSRSSSRIT